MPNPSFKTWACTLRPAAGMNSTIASKVVNMLLTKSKIDYFHVGEEKEGIESHWHMSLWFATPQQRSNVQRMFIDLLITDLSVVEASVFRRGTKIMYNNDFMLNYVGDASKGDAFKVVEQRLPPNLGELLCYYPPKEDGSARGNADPELYAWSQLCYDLTVPTNRVAVHNRVQRVIYEEKLKGRPCCQIRYPAFIGSLTKYINGKGEFWRRPPAGSERFEV